MKLTPFRGRQSAFALLAALLFVWPGVARSNGEEDVKKEIADVEKQIAELKKKLDDLRKSKEPKALPALNWDLFTKNQATFGEAGGGIGARDGGEGSSGGSCAQSTPSRTIAG